MQTVFFTQPNKQRIFAPFSVVVLCSPVEMSFFLSLGENLVRVDACVQITHQRTATRGLCISSQTFVLYSEVEDEAHNTQKMDC